MLIGDVKAFPLERLFFRPSKKAPCLSLVERPSLDRAQLYRHSPLQYRMAEGTGCAEGGRTAGPDEATRSARRAVRTVSQFVSGCSTTLEDEYVARAWKSSRLIEFLHLNWCSFENLRVACKVRNDKVVVALVSPRQIYPKQAITKWLALGLRRPIQSDIIKAIRSTH